GFRLEPRRGEHVEDPARRGGVERDGDGVVSDRHGVVGRTGDGGRSEAPQDAGRRGRRGDRHRAHERRESEGLLHPTIAGNARSGPEKSSKSASGFSAARASMLVIPVATATARTPRDRPQATSWTESPTTTIALPSNRRPVRAKARSTAMGGSSYRSAESLP